MEHVSVNVVSKVLIVSILFVPASALIVEHAKTVFACVSILGLVLIVLKWRATHLVVTKENVLMALVNAKRDTVE